MNSNEDDGIESYLKSPTLLQYSPKKDIEPKEDDFFKRINPKTEEKKDSEQISAISETLNSMFPPKKWEEDGHKYVQYVSPIPASREKSRALFKALEQRKKEKRAREKGICPVRQELYSQCFDEIIRQVTIDSPERGLLLLRVRDEIKMTIASYQTLYESAQLYGIRKQVQAEDSKEELKKELLEKEQKNIELTNKKILLEDKLASLKKHFAERNEIESTKREKDITFLKQQKENLERFLRDITNTQEKK